MSRINCVKNDNTVRDVQVILNTNIIVVVVLGFYVPPTAKVIRRRDLGLKSHPKDLRSPRSNTRPLVYKAISLTTTPRRLLDIIVVVICQNL